MTLQIMTLFGISNCDTIKKTRRWLEENNIDYQYHDYRKQGLDIALASEILQAVPLQILINKRGSTWRALPADVQQSLNQDTAAALMIAYPAVIKRPLLRGSAGWLCSSDATDLRKFAHGTQA